MSTTMPSPSSSLRSVGWWCALAPLGPEATIVSKERPSAPSSRIVRSMSHATSRSVMPGRSLAPTVSIASSAKSMARCITASSDGSLSARSCVAIEPVGMSSGTGSRLPNRSLSELNMDTLMSPSSIPTRLDPEEAATSSIHSRPEVMRTTV